MRSERFTHPLLDGVTLHALHHGAAGRPTLVLLHGGGANAHWWDHLAPTLAERFHVVALDFRGHGDSDFPETAVAGAFSDDLDALLDMLGAPDAVLVGHSMGARIALERAARRPGTPALVLIDPAWRLSERRRDAARRVLTFRFTYASREDAIRRFRFQPEAKPTEALRRAIAEHSVREDADGRFGFKFDPRWFSLPYRELPPLDRLSGPTLVLRGEHSPLLSEEAAADLCGRLPDVRLTVVPDSGHHVLIDQPRAVLAALEDFLEEHGR